MVDAFSSGVAILGISGFTAALMRYLWWDD